jgi:serine/threonine protein kinase
MGAELKQGGFGCVYYGVFKKNKTKPFAAKCFNDFSGDLVDWGNFVHELVVHANLSHPNIVLLIAVCTSPKYPALILEFMNRGSLSTYIKENRQPFNDYQTQLIKISVVNAIAYIHAKKLVHQDIKSANVLINQVNETLTIKLADFGLTNKVGKTKKAGTPTWYAPELKQRGSLASLATDIYALGLLLWVIASYKNLNKRLLKNVEEEQFSSVCDGFTSVFSMVLVSCLDKDPLKRPEAIEIEELLHQDHLIPTAVQSNVS